mmetsp:Transcript_16609/g.21712  ORF Transcript_16609/g.21712 Transcript_16609/m.21712 type:complete len:111 (+) Transcript_16609:690-1022(+)
MSDVTADTNNNDIMMMGRPNNHSPIHQEEQGQFRQQQQLHPDGSSSSSRQSGSYSIHNFAAKDDHDDQSATMDTVHVDDEAVANLVAMEFDTERVWLQPSENMTIMWSEP